MLVRTQIQIVVANIIEAWGLRDMLTPGVQDRANHENEQWGTVKKKKQVKAGDSFERGSSRLRRRRR